MNSKAIWITIAASTLAFVAGFLFANTFNRSELDQLRAENDKLKSAAETGREQTEETTLTDAEIQAKIAEADQNAGNFQFQKNLGVALYRYGNFKKDRKLLADAIRILERADKLNTSDVDIKISLGNAYFDVAYYKKSERSDTVDSINSDFETARRFYDEALKLRPNDAAVITDIGLTHFLSEPADYKTAAAELERALAFDPMHERAIQFLVEAKWRLGRNDEAAKYLEQLRTAYPKNPTIGDLTAMLTQPPTAR